MIRTISDIDRAQGGPRLGAGQKPNWFREKCAELALSPKFFTFAERVFNGDMVEPKLTKQGGIYMEASVHDKIYLWEKLAAYGFGKPVEIAAAGSPLSPEDSKRKADEVWSLIKGLEDNGNDRPAPSGDSGSVENRTTPI